MRIILTTTLLSLVLFTGSATAHFQVLLPSSDMVTDDHKTVELTALFTHPMEQGPVMDMGLPKQFGVLVNGKKENLLPILQAKKQDGKTFFTATYSPKLPADYIFFLEPAPYWEAAEGKMIVHYTKVVIDAFGAEAGWEEAVGLPVEIEPLVRPYGLWTGNLFRGIVKQEGKAVPFAKVEVEYFNTGKKVKVPADSFITQVIKADGNGVFAYAMPKAGWWGFAALIEGKEWLPNPAGKKVPVELGGLIWVKTVDMGF
jgi:cobalt/nickel transport protein